MCIRGLGDLEVFGFCSLFCFSFDGYVRVDLAFFLVFVCYSLKIFFMLRFSRILRLWFSISVFLKFRLVIC